MKKFILWCSLFLFAAPARSQQETPVYASSHLWQKGQDQRAVGLVLLTGGAVVTTVGMAAGVSNKLVDAFSGSANAKGTGATLTGLGLMTASIPFFVLGGKNKKASVALSGLSAQPSTASGRWTSRRPPQFQFTFTKTLF